MDVSTAAYDAVVQDHFDHLAIASSVEPVQSCAREPPPSPTTEQIEEGWARYLALTAKMDEIAAPSPLEANVPVVDVRMREGASSTVAAADALPHESTKEDFDAVVRDYYTRAEAAQTLAAQARADALARAKLDEEEEEGDVEFRAPRTLEEALCPDGKPLEDPAVKAFVERAKMENDRMPRMPEAPTDPATAKHLQAVEDYLVTGSLPEHPEPGLLEELSRDSAAQFPDDPRVGGTNAKAELWVYNPKLKTLVPQTKAGIRATKVRDLLAQKAHLGRPSMGNNSFGGLAHGVGYILLHMSVILDQVHTFVMKALAEACDTKDLDMSIHMISSGVTSHAVETDPELGLQDQLDRVRNDLTTGKTECIILLWKRSTCTLAFIPGKKWDVILNQAEATVKAASLKESMQDGAGVDTFFSFKGVTSNPAALRSTGLGVKDVEYIQRPVDELKPDRPRFRAGTFSLTCRVDKWPSSDQFKFETNNLQAPDAPIKYALRMKKLRQQFERAAAADAAPAEPAGLCTGGGGGGVSESKSDA